MKNDRQTIRRNKIETIYVDQFGNVLTDVPKYRSACPVWHDGESWCTYTTIHKRFSKTSCPDDTHPVSEVRSFATKEAAIDFAKVRMQERFRTLAILGGY